MITLRLDARIDNLVVEKLRVLWLPCYAPRIVIEQSAKKCQLSVLVEYFNAHEVAQLPNERSYSLVQAPQVLFDVGAQQDLHCAVSELCFEFCDPAGGVSQ